MFRQAMRDLEVLAIKATAHPITIGGNPALFEKVVRDGLSGHK
jgi:hypothetical protein